MFAEYSKLAFYFTIILSLLLFALDNAAQTQIQSSTATSPDVFLSMAKGPTPSLTLGNNNQSVVNAHEDQQSAMLLSRYGISHYKPLFKIVHDEWSKVDGNNNNNSSPIENFGTINILHDHYSCRREPHFKCLTVNFCVAPALVLDGVGDCADDSDEDVNVVNECELGPEAQPAGLRCAPDAVCIDTKLGYQCLCMPGYAGNGFICDATPPPLIQSVTLDTGTHNNNFDENVPIPLLLEIRLQSNNDSNFNGLVRFSNLPASSVLNKGFFGGDNTTWIIPRETWTVDRDGFIIETELTLPRGWSGSLSSDVEVFINRGEFTRTSFVVDGLQLQIRPVAGIPKLVVRSSCYINPDQPDVRLSIRAALNSNDNLDGSEKLAVIIDGLPAIVGIEPVVEKLNRDSVRLDVSALHLARLIKPPAASFMPFNLTVIVMSIEEANLDRKTVNATLVVDQCPDDLGTTLGVETSVLPLREAEPFQLALSLTVSRPYDHVHQAEVEISNLPIGTRLDAGGPLTTTSWLVSLANTDEHPPNVINSWSVYEQPNSSILARNVTVTLPPTFTGALWLDVKGDVRYENSYFSDAKKVYLHIEPKPESRQETTMARLLVSSSPNCFKNQDRIVRLQLTIQPYKTRPNLNETYTVYVKMPHTLRMADGRRRPLGDKNNDRQYVIMHDEFERSSNALELAIETPTTFSEALEQEKNADDVQNKNFIFYFTFLVLDSKTYRQTVSNFEYNFTECMPSVYKEADRLGQQLPIQPSIDAEYSSQPFLRPPFSSYVSTPLVENKSSFVHVDKDRQTRYDAYGGLSQTPQQPISNSHQTLAHFPLQTLPGNDYEHNNFYSTAKSSASYAPLLTNRPTVNSKTFSDERATSTAWQKTLPESHGFFVQRKPDGQNVVVSHDGKTHGNFILPPQHSSPYYAPKLSARTNDFSRAQLSPLNISHVTETDENNLQRRLRPQDASPLSYTINKRHTQIAADAKKEQQAIQPQLIDRIFTHNQPTLSRWFSPAALKMLERKKQNSGHVTKSASPEFTEQIPMHSYSAAPLVPEHVPLSDHGTVDGHEQNLTDKKNSPPAEFPQQTEINVITEQQPIFHFKSDAQYSSPSKNKLTRNTPYRRPAMSSEAQLVLMAETEASAPLNPKITQNNDVLAAGDAQQPAVQFNTHLRPLKVQAGASVFFTFDYRNLQNEKTDQSYPLNVIGELHLPEGYQVVSSQRAASGHWSVAPGVDYEISTRNGHNRHSGEQQLVRFVGKAFRPDGATDEPIFREEKRFDLHVEPHDQQEIELKIDKWPVCLQRFPLRLPWQVLLRDPVSNVLEKLEITLQKRDINVIPSNYTSDLTHTYIPSTGVLSGTFEVRSIWNNSIVATREPFNILIKAIAYSTRNPEHKIMDVFKPKPLQTCMDSALPQASAKRPPPDPEPQYNEDDAPSSRANAAARRMPNASSPLLSFDSQNLKFFVWCLLTVFVVRDALHAIT